MHLSEEAATLADRAMRSDTPRPDGDPAFHMPDEVWVRVMYDVLVSAHARAVEVDRLVASLIPLYFGRVASLIFETRQLTTDQAEAFIERQARAFELLKPYLVEKWGEATTGARRAGDRRALRHPEARSARSAARAERVTTRAGQDPRKGRAK
jgi:hypothetical protein